MTCTAPYACPTARRGCNDAPTTPQELLRRTPAASVAMSPLQIVLSAPAGTLLFLDYATAGSPSPECLSNSAGLAIEAGMPRNHYIGRLVSAERRYGGDGPYTIIRMVCLNRGVPGAPQVRTFSTKVGQLNGALLLELPVEAVAPAAMVCA